MHLGMTLKGVTGLLMHNPRLADPSDEYTRALAEITSKGSKMTDADYAEAARIQWYGGLYHDPDMGLYVPTWNVVRCLEQAAKVTRQGTTLVRALAVLSDRVPLVTGAPRDLAQLYARPEYSSRMSVGIQRGRVMRTRPIFRSWSLVLEMELMEDVLSYSNLVTIADLAGRSEGLGDARKLGFGRFSAEVAV